MKFILRYGREIIIKSRPVRKRFTKVLFTNIKNSLAQLDTKMNIFYSFDRLDLEIFDEQKALEAIEILRKIPGIELFSIVNTYDFETLEDVKEKAIEYFADKIANKTFVVRVKRTWTHIFSSLQAEREIGGALLAHSNNSKVKLINPDFTVNIEIIKNKFHLVVDTIKATWGYPVWVQERVISLISGWFDSSISSYLMSKRWVRVDYLFFNLWWVSHEIWVKQISKYLWQNFSSSYKAKFISVDFEKLTYEIATKIENKYKGIILKILMYKIAEMVANKWYHYAMVTWESIGQVSSQTLVNMAVIDSFVNTLVLRPLLTYNKQEIIEIAKDIGTYNFSISMPEYCWMISVNPTTEARLEALQKEFEKIDKDLIIETFENIKISDIRNVFTQETVSEIEKVTELTGEIIIDIREKEKREKNPLKLEKNEILNIPFYEINSKFPKLKQDKNYLFYCDKWVLSELHALYLKQAWFNNIKIYRNEKAK